MYPQALAMYPVAPCIHAPVAIYAMNPHGNCIHVHVPADAFAESGYAPWATAQIYFSLKASVLS
jgi:hypothetical protein